MTSAWSPLETNTHQDHVIAHVIGTTVLGYFIVDEAIHILLDIGFIWTIYIDGEMGLLQQSVAISELELDEDAKAELLADAQLLHDDGIAAEGLVRFTPSPVDLLIIEVSFYARDGQRRLIITGEETNIAVVTSLATGEINVHAFPTESNSS